MNTKHLKAKILDLAIRGKLVPQDSSEGNAADLLKKIRDEKGGESLPLAAAGKPSSATPSAGLVAARNARSKNTSFIIKAEDGRHYEQFADGTLKDIEDEIPFEIPENWCWCRLKDVCKEISDLDHRMPKSFPNGIPYISPLDFTKDGKINLKNAKRVSPLDYEDLSRKSKPEKGDIIFPRYGTIGKVRRIDFDEPCLVSYSCATIKVSLQNMNDNYIVYVLKSPLIQTNEIQKYINETTQANVGLQSIKDFKFPLPPLSEQQRIVSAIEKAFEQIDIIEKNKINLKTYIKQTKSKVLDLAIHGKLVEQNPQEGNAFELLEKIRNEKAELIKQKKLKEDKSASFIIKTDDGKHYEQFADGTLKDIEDEIPFEIPESWCWCRFKEISSLISGQDLEPKFYNAEKKGIPYLTGASNFIDEKIIINRWTETPKSIAIRNDLLITCKGTIGKLAFLNEEKVHIARQIMAIRPFNTIDAKYLKYYFSYNISQLESGATSMIPGVSRDVILPMLLPLPPLSEQQRIVAKIEQIFAQLDALEKSLGE